MLPLDYQSLDVYETDFLPTNETIYYYYEVDDMYHITGQIDKYVLPFICLLGIPANLIAAVVFSTKTFRQASFGVNLIAKSVYDSVFLICTLLVWLENVQIHILHTPGVCQIVVFLTYVSAFTSVWSMVALAFENLIRIRYPFKVVVLCQAKRAWITTAATTTIAFLVYLPMLWVNHVFDVDGLGICQGKENMKIVSSVYTYLDTLITLIIPCGFIVGCLVMTIETVCILKARSRRMFHDVRVSLSVILQQQITRMLSAVSLSFILLTFPSHMTRVILLMVVWTNGTRDISPTQYLTQHIFQLLYYLSFTVNILTYIIFCPKVRKTLRQAVCWFCPVFQTDQLSELHSNSIITDRISSGSSDNQRSKTVRLTLEVKIKKCHIKGIASDRFQMPTSAAPV